MAPLPEATQPRPFLLHTNRAGALAPGWNLLQFGCEGEDAHLTGMTRSPLRRVLALNIPRVTPQSAAIHPLVVERMA